MFDAMIWVLKLNAYLQHAHEDKNGPKINGSHLVKTIQFAEEHRTNAKNEFVSAKKAGKSVPRQDQYNGCWAGVQSWLQGMK